MQAFVYCRVSSEEQASDNHYSLENQEAKGRDYCRSRGWRTADVRKDIASGKDASRIGYHDLLTAVRTERIDVVVVYRLDRLSRNVRDIYDFVDLAADHNVALVSLNENLDTTTAMGRAMLGVMAVFAQLTREMIAENVKDGLLRRAQAGLYTGNKQGPLGYRYEPDRNSLIPLPQEAEVVQLIFELFTQRKWGIEKIVGYLNETDVPTKTGARWHKSNVGRIIRNPVYAGKIHCNEGIYDGKHEAIVSPEAFAQAQEIIGSHSTLPGRSHQSQHLLSGVARCGMCGKRLIAHYGPARKNGERFIFYFHRPERTRGGCKGFYKSASRLEGYVVDAIRSAAQTDRLQQIAVVELEQMAQCKAAPLREKADSIVSELAQMKERFNTWADRLDRKLIDEEQFTQQNGRLLERKRELQDELAEIERKLAECENAQISLDAARKALAGFHELWENLGMEERREMVRLLVEKLEVNKDSLTLKLLYLPEEQTQLSGR